MNANAMVAAEESFRRAIQASDKTIALIAYATLQRQREDLLAELGSAVDSELIKDMSDLKDVEILLIASLGEEDA